MNKLIILIMVCLISGCYQKIDPSIMHTYTNAQLCSGAKATSANGDAPLIELVKRGVLSELDVSNIKNKQLRVGLPECALVAMIGLPNQPPLYCGTINTSTGSYGHRKQLVYRHCQKNRKTFYIYIMNGKVSSWQNW